MYEQLTIHTSYIRQQEQIKQGWTLLSTLHCVLLHEKVRNSNILELWFNYYHILFNIQQVTYYLCIKSILNDGDDFLSAYCI